MPIDKNRCESFVANIFSRPVFLLFEKHTPRTTLFVVEQINIRRTKKRRPLPSGRFDPALKKTLLFLDYCSVRENYPRIVQKYSYFFFFAKNFIYSIDVVLHPRTRFFARVLSIAIFILVHLVWFVTQVTSLYSHYRAFFTLKLCASPGNNIIREPRRFFDAYYTSCDFFFSFLQ